MNINYKKVLIVIISLFVISCENHQKKKPIQKLENIKNYQIQPTDSNTKVQATNSVTNLLDFIILDKEITDTRYKAQILMDILISDKKDNITKSGLKLLLDSLYNAKINTSGFEHHAFANSVAIYAYSTKEKADAGMGQWIAMISKFGNDNNPEFKFSEIQFAALSSKKIKRWGLSPEERKEIWEKIILAEREAANEARKVYPVEPGMTKEELIKSGELMEKLNKQKNQKIIRKYNIRKTTLDSIGLEGLVKGWAFPEWK